MGRGVGVGANQGVRVINRVGMGPGSGSPNINQPWGELGVRGPPTGRLCPGRPSVHRPAGGIGRVAGNALHSRGRRDGPDGGRSPSLLSRKGPHRGNKPEGP
jgi:hypothetical protein